MKIHPLTYDSILSTRKVAVVFALWTIFVSMFCNIDSYLYAQCGQFDSAVFFMCGKAMMHGMTPYADFTDSKGVLLWFIYGIGYLIDNYSYVGVFWLACVNLWGTLLIAYQTARLWLWPMAALVAAMLLIVPLTYWNFYCETKAEHFCWPAVAWGIYVLMKSFVGRCVTFRDFFWLGVGVIACLMLKWSVAVMMLSLVCSIGWWAWRGRYFQRFVCGFAVGTLAAIVPFAVAFTCWDNWPDVWREYFVNTLASVSVPMDETLAAYANEWQQMFTTRRFIYLLYTLPVLFLWRRKDWFATALPALCGLTFIALSIRHDNSGHYISVVGPFAIVAIALAMKWGIKKGLRLRYFSLCGLLCVSYVIWGSIRYTDTFCTKASKRFDKFMSVSAAMSAVENPRVIVIGQERGVCMATSLPGTRYWITQLGRTEQMWKEQMAAVDSCVADFVILFGEESAVMNEHLLADGYRFLDNFYGGQVYTTLNVQMPSIIKHFSAWDIVTKKTYAEMYE